MAFITAHISEIGILFKSMFKDSSLFEPGRRTNIERYKILRAASENKPQCLTEIALSVRYKKNTLSELLNRMVNDKMVVRKDFTKDRRKINLRITAAGRTAMVEFEKRFAAVMEAALDKMSPPLRESFLQSLGAIIMVSMTYQKEAMHND